MNNAVGNSSTLKVLYKSNSTTHIKPSSNLLLDSFLTKVLIFILEELLVFYSKELKEKFNNKKLNITPKRNLILKILTFSTTKFKLKDNKSISKFLLKIVSKICKSLLNSKMINKKSLSGLQNFSSLTKLLTKHQEHYKKFNTNVLNF